jgi:hypothetical protein
MIPADDAETATFNQKMGKEITQRGEQVIYIAASKSTPTQERYDRFSTVQDAPPHTNRPPAPKAQ